MIIPAVAIACLFFCYGCDEDGGSAVVTVVNVSDYEVTDIRLTYYSDTGDCPQLASLMPGESHEFSITWGYGPGPGCGKNIEYYINGKHFDVESEVGARKGTDGGRYSPVQVERDSRVTITIYNDRYEISVR